MLMKLFNKLQSNLNEVKKYYDIDNDIKVSCNNKVWTVEINQQSRTGDNLEELLKEMIDYYNLSNFRAMEEREWM